MSAKLKRKPVAFFNSQEYIYSIDKFGNVN